MTCSGTQLLSAEWDRWEPVERQTVKVQIRAAGGRQTAGPHYRTVKLRGTRRGFLEEVTAEGACAKALRGACAWLV